MTATSTGDTTEAPILDIGEVVRRSGLPPSTLHVWEKHGLIAPSGREGLRRQYDADILQRIAVIVVCQRSGFSLAGIAELLAPDAFTEGKGRLADKLDELRRRQRDLAAAVTGLEHALACPAPSPIECPKFVSKLADVLPVERED